MAQPDPSETTAVLGEGTPTLDEFLQAKDDDEPTDLSEYIKSTVFGGLDGIITTFAVVAAGAGANLEGKVIVLMGFANLVSDGISMGLGDYFSEKSENQFIRVRPRIIRKVSLVHSLTLCCAGGEETRRMGDGEQSGGRDKGNGRNLPGQ